MQRPLVYAVGWCICCICCVAQSQPQVAPGGNVELESTFDASPTAQVFPEPRAAPDEPLVLRKADFISDFCNWFFVERDDSWLRMLIVVAIGVVSIALRVAYVRYML